jgi:hypothetical protein
VLSKEEDNSVKHRLITDCRELNQFMSTQKFALDNIQQIVPGLSKGQWACKVDLKDAYFHLPIHHSLKPFLRLKVGEQVWEFQAGCFGLSTMPQLFMMVMKTFLKKWRQAGIQVYIYLDDILVLGHSKKEVERSLLMVVSDLVAAGFKINTKKSVLEGCQNLVHLGFVLNLKEGKLELPPG